MSTLFIVLPFAAILLLSGAFAEPARSATRVLPASPRPADRLAVVDLRGAGWETRAAMACLQGIVNRKKPRLYVLTSTHDEKWLDDLIERRYVREKEVLSGIHDAVSRFRGEIGGAVVWDDDLPETVNIASMEASRRGAVAVSSDLAKEWNLPISLDLRGRWKTAREVFDWSLANLRPKMRPGVMASIFPAAASQGVRDYAVAHRIFTFWADDAASLERVAAAFPPNTALIGYWGHGHYGTPAYRGISEYDGLLILSRHGHFSSGSEFSSNWSVHAGVRVPSRAFARRPLPPPETDPAKAYVAIHVVESGDALWYWQSRQRDVWEDPRLGDVPMGWSLNPTARDVIPAVLEWYYRRAPANQEFYGALSGLGYLSASHFGEALPDADAAWDAHMRLLGRYLRGLSLRGVAMWTGPWRVPDNIEEVLGEYASRLPDADYLLPDMGRAENVSDSEANRVVTGPGGSRTAEGLVAMHCRTRWRVGPPADREEEIAWLVEEIRSHTPSARPAFVSAMAYSWTHDPSSVAEVVRRLGPGYVAVTPSQLAAMVRRERTP